MTEVAAIALMMPVMIYFFMIRFLGLFAMQVVLRPGDWWNVQSWARKNFTELRD